MSSWLDAVALLLTIVFVVGIVWAAIYAVNATSEAVKSTKENLKSRGLDISKEGVSVKTSRRFDREDYVDATQRGFIKAMGAASFGTADTPANSPSSPSSPPSTFLQNSSSSSAISSTDEKDTDKKKKGLFGLRKSTGK